jgi:hypothetical protein
MRKVIDVCAKAMVFGLGVTFARPTEKYFGVANPIFYLTFLWAFEAKEEPWKMKSHPTEEGTENRGSAAPAFVGKEFWFAMLIAAGIFLLGYSCREQILSNPVGDLDLVLSRCPSAELETLDAWPRTETHIRKKRNQLSTLNPDEIIERFDLEEGRTEYTFNLFANSAAASKYYNSERPRRPSVAPVKLEKVVDANVRGFLRYVIRPRACSAALKTPMDYYMSDAVFQLRNAVVEVEVRLEHKKDRDMEVALKRLAEIVGSSASENQDKK